MGNHIVCCRQKWSQLYESEEKICTNFSTSKVAYNNPAASFSGEVWRAASTAQLCGTHESDHLSKERLLQGSKSGVTQHIREREPEDTEFDPSLNASRCALFISGFKQDLHYSSPSGNEAYANKVPTTPGPTCKHSSRQSFTPPMKRWSSCSTVYIGESCLVHPNQKSTLWSTSVAVDSLVRSEENQRLSAPVRNFLTEHPWTPDQEYSIGVYDDVYRLFDERKHSLEKYPANSSSACTQPDFTRNPEAADVHQFLCRLFNTALLGPECAIVALIFLERLVNAAEVGILPWSWRRQLLACILLASKILDDQAVWNTDYCQILRDVCVDDLNALERHTLALLQFNIDVPPAVYARYYFDLLYVAQISGVANQPCKRRRLTTELAQQLRLLPAQTSELSSTNAGFLFDLPRVDPLHAKSRKSSRDPDYQMADTQKRSKKYRTVSSDKNKTQISLRAETIVPNSTTTTVTSSHNPVSSCSVIPSTAAVQSTTTVTNPNPVRDPFADSAIIYTLEPIPAAQSSCDEDEGPLQLDDETDLINTLTASLVSSPLNEVLPTSSSSNQPTSTYSSRNHSNLWNSFRPSATSTAENAPDTTSNRWTTIRSQAYDPLRVTSNETVSNSSAFVRTLMGGDVAYSLLRDAGMY